MALQARRRHPWRGSAFLVRAGTEKGAPLSGEAKEDSLSRVICTPASLARLVLTGEDFHLFIDPTTELRVRRERFWPEILTNGGGFLFMNGTVSKK